MWEYKTVVIKAKSSFLSEMKVNWWEKINNYFDRRKI